MIEQKKRSLSLKKIGFHKRDTKSLSDLSHYGPPATTPPFIQPQLGYPLRKHPLGLRKVKRHVLFQKAGRAQSNAYLAMRSGQANICKRFRKLRYLQSWKSKKPMHNLCEQNMISRLHQNLSRVQVKQRSMTACARPSPHF